MKGYQEVIVAVFLYLLVGLLTYSFCYIFNGYLSHPYGFHLEGGAVFWIFAWSLTLSFWLYMFVGDYFTIILNHFHQYLDTFKH